MKTYTKEEVIELIKSAIYSDIYYRNIINDSSDENDPHWDDMGAIIEEENFNKWIEENLK